MAVLRVKKKGRINDGPECFERLNVPHSPCPAGQRFIRPATTGQEEKQRVQQLVSSNQDLLQTGHVSDGSSLSMSAKPAGIGR